MCGWLRLNESRHREQKDCRFVVSNVTPAPTQINGVEDMLYMPLRYQVAAFRNRRKGAQTTIAEHMPSARRALSPGGYTLRDASDGNKVGAIEFRICL